MCNSQGCVEGLYEAFKKRLLQEGAAVCRNELAARQFAARLARDGVKFAMTQAGEKLFAFRLE